MASSDFSNSQDIISLILQDHKKVLHIFDQYEQATDISQRELLVRDAVRELSLHASKEEMTLYESLRNGDLLVDGKEKAEHGWFEHEETKKLLYKLDVALKPTDMAFDSTMRQVINLMRSHIQEEEEELLPAIKKCCEEKKLIELGKSYVRHESIAVTRPHPSAPDKGILGKMANAASKPIDAFRDAMSSQ
jgi:hemerythrin-like domain-containing protein